MKIKYLYLLVIIFFMSSQIFIHAVSSVPEDINTILYSSMNTNIESTWKCTLKPNDISSYVNPFIGTGVYSKFGAMGSANCYPGAVVPFGMVQLSPYTGKHIAGYLYEDRYIGGFAHTHLSGCGTFGLGNILFMPTTGSLSIKEKEYRSTFSHQSETASPGYYQVLLLDHKINVELTATTHAGFHKYTFLDNTTSHILIDVTHTLEYFQPIEASVEMLDEQTIAGYMTISRPFLTGKGPYTTFFVAQFNQPFDSYGTWKNHKLYPQTRTQSGTDIGFYIDYRNVINGSILAKVGISYISTKQAVLNLEAEIPDWNFSKVQKNARDAWNNELLKVEINGGTEEQKIIFYTALYHSFLMPHTFSDINGKYLGMDDIIHTQKEFPHYATFSLWDTFRSQHPLLVLLQPQRQNEMIQSLIDMYQQGGWFPQWPFLNRYTDCMIGDHAISVIVDSYLKGIQNFDILLAYEGMQKGATELPPRSHDFSGRTGLHYYQTIGFVPFGRVYQSVSKTLEYAYDDWCLSELAQALGKSEDHQLFFTRSQNYRNLFDPLSKFIRPKLLRPVLIEGRWKRPFLPGSWIGFTEGNSWTYTWFVPHDVAGLIELMGKERFIKRLDHFFEKFVYPSWFIPFSHYWHGNEPDQHVAFFYNYAGEPWKTQETVRRIMDTLYSSGPDGIPGNEDCGQLSSWYVFNAMGFYPVCPGNCTYAIGSPIFNEIIIHLDTQFYNTDTFIIRANNVSKENMYVQSVSLNGIPVIKPWFDHASILQGGVLTFEMGDKPSKWSS